MGEGKEGRGRKGRGGNVAFHHVLLSNLTTVKMPDAIGDPCKCVNLI